MGLRPELSLGKRAGPGGILGTVGVQDIAKDLEWGNVG
jgi:hypothetical protein